MKKLFTVLCMAACLFGFSVNTFAAEDVKSQDAYISYGANLDSLVQELAAYSDEELNTLLSSATSEQDVQLLESWLAVKDELGAYVGVLECEAEEGKTEITVTMKFDFENRDVIMTYTANSETANIGFEKVLTKGEIFKKAGMNTLIGMGTVFFVLIFISLIIGTFKYIPNGAEKKNAKKAEPALEKEIELPSEDAEENLTDDLELVAVITAAIAAAEGTSTDGVVIRSIKRANNAKWKRA